MLQWAAPALVTLCLTLAAAGVAAHPLGDPPGRLVDIGGRRLHLYCQGQDAPTVIIDTGLGATSLEWEAVMRQVAGVLGICVYDRAGYGWSDPAPPPRTSAQNAEDLRLLLQNAGLRGPFILVGHSYGGYDVQLFARRYPQLTAGLVLVDASHPQQIERFLAPPYNLRIAPSARDGEVRFGEPPPPPSGLSRAAQRLARYQQEYWVPRRSISNELLGFRDSARELQEAPPLGAMPLVVLSRGRRVWPAGAHGDQLEQLWMTLQSELAGQSPTSVHLVARASGHQIYLEQPALVAFAIALVNEAGLRRQGDTTPRATTTDRWLESLDVRNVAWLHDTLSVGMPAQVAALLAPATVAP